MQVRNIDTLIFLHIPKTAGSTFHMILNNRYKADSIYNVFGARYTDLEIVHFIDMPEQKKAKIKLLKGHMPFGLHKYIAGNFKYIAMLRHPVERVISQYFYIKKNPYNPLHNDIEHGGMSLADYVSSGISLGANNGQCRFLSGGIDEYPFSDNCEEIFRNAINNIEKYFLWTGITERFDESVLLLSYLLGWNKPPYYIRENVSKIRKKREEISDSDIEVLEKYNAEDLKLYEYANRLLDNQIGQLKDFPDSLEHYKQKNYKIQRRWGWLPDKLRRHVI